MARIKDWKKRGEGEGYTIWECTKYPDISLNLQKIGRSYCVTYNLKRGISRQIGCADDKKTALKMAYKFMRKYPKNKPYHEFVRGWGVEI